MFNFFYYLGDTTVKAIKEGNNNLAGAMGYLTLGGAMFGLEVAGKGLSKFSSPVLQNIGNKLNGLVTKNPRVLGGVALLDGAVILGAETYHQIKKDGYSFSDIDPFFHKGIGVKSSGLVLLDTDNLFLYIPHPPNRMFFHSHSYPISSDQ